MLPDFPTLSFSFNNGTGDVNQEAVVFCNQRIDELLAQGMTPFITLFHFDMPMAMPEQEGRKNHQVVAAFSPTCG
ncbi:hypothetical protein B9D02_22715 (plasmid) [Pantoea vagans]|nr:hypothetical protein B9D02_22715 [Pantoea vagans]